MYELTWPLRDLECNQHQIPIDFYISEIPKLEPKTFHPLEQREVHYLSSTCLGRIKCVESDALRCKLGYLQLTKFHEEFQKQKFSGLKKPSAILTIKPLHCEEFLHQNVAENDRSYFKAYLNLIYRKLVDLSAIDITKLLDEKRVSYFRDHYNLTTKHLKKIVEFLCTKDTEDYQIIRDVIFKKLKDNRPLCKVLPGPLTEQYKGHVIKSNIYKEFLQILPDTASASSAAMSVKLNFGEYLETTLLNLDAFLEKKFTQKPKDQFLNMLFSRLCGESENFDMYLHVRELYLRVVFKFFNRFYEKLIKNTTVLRDL